MDIIPQASGTEAKEAQTKHRSAEATGREHSLYSGIIARLMLVVLAALWCAAQQPQNSPSSPEAGGAQKSQSGSVPDATDASATKSDPPGPTFGAFSVGFLGSGKFPGCTISQPGDYDYYLDYADGFGRCGSY
jgi:hypothetical protein